MKFPAFPSLFRLFLPLIAAPLLLSACQSVGSAVDNTRDGMDMIYDTADDAVTTMGEIPTKPEDYLQNNCPPVKLVNDLGAFSDFTDFRQPDDAHLITRVTVRKEGSACTYTDKSVTVDMQLAFDAVLGRGAPNSPETYYSYPFFIAITSPTGVILAREIFSAPVTFGPGQTHQTHRENMRQIIPLSKPEHGHNYTVLIGFQLNKQQLAYNRAVEKVRQKQVQKNAKANRATLEQTIDTRDHVILQQNTTTTTTTIAPVVPVDSAPVSLVPAGR